ncbi:unnamed protein product [Aphanomyces euteiches]
MAFTGLTDHEDRKKAAFNEGNLQYAAGSYEKAVELYKEAPEKLDKYLNSGNASFKLGEAAQEAQQKLQFYQEAVKTYKLGVLKFPENVALKYNYEYVLKKLESQQQDQQNQQDSDKNDKGDDKKQENQDKQDGQDQDNQKGEGQKDQQGDQKDNQDGQQPSPSGQPDKQDGQQSPQAEQGDQSSPSPGGESSAQAQSGLSDKELEQVMGMLEKQEEESLKNNQEIKKQDKGEAYDW